MNMATPDTSSAPRYSRMVALHSLGWLVAANLVGVWLAVSLIWPAIGNLLAPLTWGRWAAVHMNWQLYGWCSLPLVGALIAWCFSEVDARAQRDAGLVFGAWTLALAVGGVSWLAGDVSGKLFLDWNGWVRTALPVAMTVLWGVLAWHARAQWNSLSRGRRALRVVVFAALFFVPAVLLWASSRSNYHPINPDSGGATGAAVLGSTLGVVTIFMLLPEFLGLQQVRRTRTFAGALAVSWGIFAVLDRGNVSHHSPVAIIALTTLLLWIPLLPLFWRRFSWPAAARGWLLAATVWWALLVINGWLSFLPGISEAFKFTHALVGHAHLAMAGLVTSVNAAILCVITRRGSPSGVLSLWQGGCALYIASMLALGWGETQAPAEFFRGETWTQALLATRLVAGVAMFAGSAKWFWVFIRA